MRGHGRPLRLPLLRNAQAVDSIVLFYTVADNPGAAMRTGWRESVNCTLEAIENVFLAVQQHSKCFVVIVAAISQIGIGLSFVVTA